MNYMKRKVLYILDLNRDALEELDGIINILDNI